nr:RNA-directed DNA polymerase, eukaryota [Tanacetum cinerariifolium]
SGGGGGDAIPHGIHVWIERFTKLKPLAFRSIATPAEAEDWITHMEMLFQVLGCLDNFKTRLASFKLEGSKAKMDWIKELNNKHKVDFLSIQETKSDHISDMDIKLLWGNYKFDYIISESVGNSGGILCVWDPSVFCKEHHIISDNFIALYGSWVSNKAKLLMISIYAPQSISSKRMLWNFISTLVSRWDSHYMVMGDFNEVRSVEDRFGSEFNAQSANEFNSFISNSGLAEIQLEGYSFTWCLQSAKKMSKLDRFFVPDGLISNKMVRFKKKLQILKKKIRSWVNDYRKKQSGHLEELRSKLRDIDRSGGTNDDILQTRLETLKKMHDVNFSNARDFMQKAKIQWAIEGDKNSKFFHGIINRKHANLAIKGVIVDGEWVDDPCRVKEEFRLHFAKRFRAPVATRYKLNYTFPNKLSSDQMVILESPVSRDEVRNAVWGCRENKSPGPDGYSAIEAGFYKGIKIGSSLNLSHLLYADDAVFIGEWSPTNLSGVMVGGNFSTSQAWEDTIGKLKARLSNWKLKTLSVGGRFTFLKSVLGSTPIYNLSIYKALKSVLHSMESLRRNFFNGVQCEERKIAWIKWTKILASKKNDGLGVSSLYALNRALLFKWDWRFISRDNSLWRRFITTMHGSNLSTSSPFRYSSWLSIIWEIHSLKDRGVDLLYHYCIHVGNGLRTSFWKEVWIGDIPHCVLFPRIYALEENKDCSVAEKLYSMCATFLMIVSCQPIATRWIKYVPIKLNVFAWKVRLNRLPTRVNLQHRGVLVSDPLCPICCSEDEDSAHIFFRCRLVTDIVRLVCRWWNMAWSSFGSYSDWLHWFNDIRLSPKVKDLLEGVFYTTWWSI